MSPPETLPALFKVLVVFLALGVATGAHATVLPADGGEPREIPPRSIAAFSFVVGNPGDASLVQAWEVSLPAGWSPLGAVSGTVAIPPGGEHWLPLLFSVPADASPGPGILALVLRDPRSGAERARALKPYTVLAAGRLKFRPGGDDPVAFGDGPYRIRRWLENRSNVPVDVELQAKSSNGWKIELSDPTVALAPGAGAWVDALVKPPAIWDSEVSHTMLLSARTVDLPEAHREARFRETTRFVSSRPRGADSLLRGSVELESSFPAGRSAGVGLNLRLAGSAGPNSRVDLRVGQRLPIGDVGALNRRDTYLDVDDSRWGGFRIGRSTRHFTRLTASNQRGKWWEVRLNSEVGKWAAFSSLSEPDLVWGKMRGLSLEFPERGRTRFGFLAFEGERAPNSPDAGFFMGSLWGKGNTATTQWDFEVAAGRLDGSGDVEPAWRLGLTGDKGRWSWNAEGQGASAAFPGAVWNHRQFWGRVGYDVLPSLELWAGGERLLSPDPSLDPAVDAFTHRVGITWPGLRFGSLALSRSHTSFGSTASHPEAVEKLWNARLDVDLRAGLVATADIEAGEREESGNRETLVRPSYALRYRSGRVWSVQARYRPAPRGEEIFGYEDRWNLFTRWQTGRRSWIELEGEQVTCGRLADNACETEPSLRVSVGQKLEGSRAGWRLVGFAHRRGGRDDITAGLRVARDLGVPVPFTQRKSKVLGTLRTSEGEPGPAGIRVYLGPRKTRTNRAGEFRFNAVPPGDHLLRLEPEDLGLSLMVDRPLPIKVRRVGRRPVSVDLRLVRPGRIKGKAVIERGPRPRETADRDPGADWEALESLGIHFQHTTFPELLHTAVSGMDGDYSVAGLLPGSWRVRVHPGDVPRDREVVWNANDGLVEVREGETVELDSIFLAWRPHPETLVEVPALTLGGRPSREHPSTETSTGTPTPVTDRGGDLGRAVSSATPTRETSASIAAPTDGLSPDPVAPPSDPEGTRVNIAGLSADRDGADRDGADEPSPGSVNPTRDRRQVAVMVVVLLAAMILWGSWVLRSRAR